MGSKFTGTDRNGPNCWTGPDCAERAIANCTARQCVPLRRTFMECSIINPALSLLMKHLVIGQRQKASNFSAFHCFMGHLTVVWFLLVNIS